MIIRGIITDLDGTLVATEKANFSAYRAALAEQGVVLSEDMYGRAFGLPVDDMLRLVAPELTDDRAAMVKARKNVLYPEYFGRLRPNTALISFLQMMKGRAKLGLATTARTENALAVLRHITMADFFDSMVFGEDVVSGKPDPECYRLCISRLGVAAADCLIFEDSPVGIAAAEAAGTAVCIVPPAYAWS